jgi:hypothetical protein
MEALTWLAGRVYQGTSHQGRRVVKMNRRTEVRFPILVQLPVTYSEALLRA